MCSPLGDSTWAIHRRSRNPVFAGSSALVERQYGDIAPAHKRRFELLGISKPTQEELFGALEFVWKALHEPDVPEEQREAAVAIREMMRSMGGPPPCCDENLLVRARMGR